MSDKIPQSFEEVAMILVVQEKEIKEIHKSIDTQNQFNAQTNRLLEEIRNNLQQYTLYGIGPQKFDTVEQAVKDLSNFKKLITGGFGLYIALFGIFNAIGALLHLIDTVLKYRYGIA